MSVTDGEFEFLENGEEIIFLLRAHPLTLIPIIILILILIFVPVLIVPILDFLNFNIFSQLGFSQSFLLLIFWYLVTFGYAFYRFVIWYFNVYILTSKRIIDIDFRGLLHKETSYANLAQVQDVTPKIRGFFGTFFHFGSVYIQTAAERPEFEFLHVGKPGEVAKTILETARTEKT